MVTVSIMSIVHLGIGLIVASVYCMLVYRKAKEPPNFQLSQYPILYRGMIMIPIDNKAIHIHHWLFFVFVTAWLLRSNVPYRTYWIGFAMGLIVQGLLYSDCFEFIIDNPWR